MNPQHDSEGSPARLHPMTRAGLAVLAAVLLSLLGIARRLEPDPRGYGTHTQLGLRPCGFRLATGTPCPTCGMTTAFAWFVRGIPVRSFAANPAGTFLAPSCVALGLWSLASAVRGRSVGFRSVETPLVTFVVVAPVITVLSWTFRVIVGGR